MDDEKKLDHEKFVSGSPGTSLFEISLLVSTAPVLLLARNLSQNVLKSQYYWVSFVLDFAFLSAPPTLSSTILSGNVPFVYVMALSYIGGLYMSSHTVRMAKSSTERHLKFLTNFRAYVNIASCVAILAVDFAIFPRRFGKVELFGSGLMDAGVGAFIASNAIVSPEARGKHVTLRSAGDRLRFVLKAVKASVPLLFLGGARLLAIKGTNYHEHVTEYGVHWNFFFTLAAVKILSALVNAIGLSSVPPLIWSFVIIVLYQVGLQQCGLHEYIVNGSDGDGGRSNLLDANREGVFSCFGYLSLYFASVQLGKFLLKPRSAEQSSWWRCFRDLALLDAVCWLLLLLLQASTQPISRRTANASFVTWMMAYNVLLLAGFLLADLIYERYFGGHQCPTAFDLLEAVNKYGLFYFLLANLLTGAVNFSLNTLAASALTSIVILVLYQFVLSYSVALLQRNKVSLKFL